MSGEKNGIRFGSAPVSAGEVYQALATMPAGIKPRPVKSGSAEMVGVPVLVYATPTGEHVAIALVVDFWRVAPYVAQWRDPETGAVRPESRGGLTFAVSIPDGYELRKIGSPQPEPSAEAPTDDEPAPSAPGIPEFANFDPAIFATDPERHSESMRNLNRKRSAPPLGDNT